MLLFLCKRLWMCVCMTGCAGERVCSCVCVCISVCVCLVDKFADLLVMLLNMLLRVQCMWVCVFLCLCMCVCLGSCVCMSDCTVGLYAFVNFCISLVSDFGFFSDSECICNCMFTYLTMCAYSIFLKFVTMSDFVSLIFCLNLNIRGRMPLTLCTLPVWTPHIAHTLDNWSRKSNVIK